MGDSRSRSLQRCHHRRSGVGSVDRPDALDQIPARLMHVSPQCTSFQFGCYVAVAPVGRCCACHDSRNESSRRCTLALCAVGLEKETLPLKGPIHAGSRSFESSYDRRLNFRDFGLVDPLVIWSAQFGPLFVVVVLSIDPLPSSCNHFTFFDAIFFRSLSLLSCRYALYSSKVAANGVVRVRFAHHHNQLCMGQYPLSKSGCIFFS